VACALVEAQAARAAVWILAVMPILRATPATRTLQASGSLLSLL
jgi:hypothetical protein